ncbi:hypothetical protein JCM19231_1434 [Vibrio ishigakensis]|uniref:Uncharacterized protein n=1 Tax=Vibrio ishigakensis TaxID=1481914 RepID=A0A0B8P1R6_9VIBR|nr:hypothetical protein JCM19231_1434 [Vibrio ishigakensis]
MKRLRFFMSQVTEALHTIINAGLLVTLYIEIAVQILMTSNA